MRLAQDVHQFTRACEHLIASAALTSRTLTDDEARLVEFYCKEVLEKVVPGTSRD